MTWEERDLEFREGLVAQDGAERLAAWLRGRRLGVAADEEPYRIVFRLAVARDAVGDLSSLVEELLRRWRDGIWQPEERAAYNALRLAALVHGSTSLGRVVWDLYEKQSVQGTYEGRESLTAALLEAMVHNQDAADERRARLWHALLRGESDPYVGGTAADAFRGLAAQDEPDRSCLARALLRVLEDTDSVELCDKLVTIAEGYHPDQNLAQIREDVHKLYRRLAIETYIRRRNQRAQAAMRGHGRRFPLTRDSMDRWNRAMREGTELLDTELEGDWLEDRRSLENRIRRIQMECVRHTEFEDVFA